MGAALLLPANAQGTLTTLGAGPGSPGPTYVGPGDVVSGAAAFYSCARAYNAAYANGTNPLCDLVDTSTGSTAVCTLRVATTGFVDLTGTYCTGSTTPSAACAAASGGACRVSQMYDQTGAARHVSNSTNSQRPVLTFSAINSLPGVTCAPASTTLLGSAATITQAQPFTSGAVFTVSSITGSGGAAVGTTNNASWSGPAHGPTLTTDIRMYAGSNVDVAGGATAGSYQSSWALFNGSSSEMMINGTNTTSLNPGTTGMTSEGLRVCRGSGVTLNGIITEASVYFSSLNSTQRGDLTTNQRSAVYGYNF